MNHAYGPHRDEDTPKTLTVLVGLAEIEVPYPAALAVQRRNLNNAAWFAGTTALEGESCR